MTAACRTVGTHIADLDERGEVPIVEIVASADPATAAEFEVRAARTLIALHDGVEVARLVGPGSRRVIAQMREVGLDGTASVPQMVPRGLIALRGAVAVVLLVVGAVAEARSLWAIGAAIAIWAVVPLVRTAHDSRTR